MRKQKKAAPGDVCQLSLGDGRYAYGRILRDASVAVYRTTTHMPAQRPVGERDFIFTVGVYDDLPGSEAFPVVGHDPFESEEDAWPPPYKVVDPITGRIQIYYRGEIRPPADPAEAEELEKAAVWDVRHILERVLAALPD